MTSASESNFSEDSKSLAKNEAVTEEDGLNVVRPVRLVEEEEDTPEFEQQLKELSSFSRALESSSGFDRSIGEMSDEAMSEQAQSHFTEMNQGQAQTEYTDKSLMIHNQRPPFSPMFLTEKYQWGIIDCKPGLLE